MTHTSTHIGEVATVEVDGRRYTGATYHVRENGWPCIQAPGGHIASGPRVDPWANDPDRTTRKEATR